MSFFNTNIFRTLFAGGDTGVMHDVELVEDVVLGNAAKVVLFNDNVHTFDEVINQVCKATGCSEQVAEGKANEVHTRGKAIVYEGDLVECMQVTSILEEIALHTQIEL